jgi:PhnB protein
MQIQAYLFFNGRCEEAIAFYKTALGAEQEMLMRFKDSPVPPQPGMVPPGSEDKVMHATLSIGETKLMCSDGTCSGTTAFSGFSLSLDMPDKAAAEKVFAALSEGGRVQMPLSPTFWSPLFGMVADKFGVGWMVSIAE